jgi:hypothetical protein
VGKIRAEEHRLGGTLVIVVYGLAYTGRCRPVSAFLAARLTQLRAAADGIESAARAGNLLTLRRSLLTFHALVAAMWKVQLGVWKPQRSQR